MKKAIFYVSSTGNTESAADSIKKILGIDDSFDLVSNINKLDDYDKIIIGTSTWGEGDLPDDLEDIWEDFCNINFSNKTVALFGLGDQDSYCDNYCDAMGTIYKQIIKSGGKVVGFTLIDDSYEHENSKAQIDDKFVGLALDEDNQSELTDDRVKKWCENIRNDFN